MTSRHHVPGGHRRRRPDRRQRGDPARPARHRVPAPGPVAGRLPAAACGPLRRRGVPHLRRRWASPSRSGPSPGRCPACNSSTRRHRVLAEFSRDPSGQVHGYPAANMFHQPELEQVLRDRLAELPQVHFRGNVEVIAVEPGAHGEEPVRVRYRDLGSGTETEVWADAVLGCDGANSITRTAVGATHGGPRLQPEMAGRRRAQPRAARRLRRGPAGLRPRPRRHLHAGDRRLLPLGVPAARRRDARRPRRAAGPRADRPVARRGRCRTSSRSCAAPGTPSAAWSPTGGSWVASSCSATPRTSPRRSSARACAPGSATPPTSPGSWPWSWTAGPTTGCSTPTRPNAARTPAAWCRWRSRSAG